MRFVRGFAAVVAFIACAQPAAAAELEGTIVAVADGDTVTLLDADRRQHRIRLDGIDAPERSQPYGQRARQSLTELAHGRAAHLDCPKTDRYGRAVCRVVVDGVDVGLEQIRRGYAWHYVKYANEQRAVDRAAYARAENHARSNNSGLWSFSDPSPPWDYRRAKKESAAPRS